MTTPHNTPGLAMTTPRNAPTVILDELIPASKYGISIHINLTHDACRCVFQVTLSSGGITRSYRADDYIARSEYGLNLFLEEVVPAFVETVRCAIQDAEPQRCAPAG